MNRGKSGGKTPPVDTTGLSERGCRGTSEQVEEDLSEIVLASRAGVLCLCPGMQLHQAEWIPWCDLRGARKSFSTQPVTLTIGRLEVDECSHLLKWQWFTVLLTTLERTW